MALLNTESRCPGVPRSAYPWRGLKAVESRSAQLRLLRAGDGLRDLGALSAFSHSTFPQGKPQGWSAQASWVTTSRLLSQNVLSVLVGISFSPQRISSAVSVLLKPHDVGRQQSVTGAGVTRGISCHIQRGTTDPRFPGKSCRCKAGRQ